MAKALGNNWARLHNDGAHITDWAFLEPQPSKWQWSDDHLQLYLDGKLTILGQFSTAPKWASYLADTSIGGDGGYFGKYFLPKDLGQYSNYVKTLAERYKGKTNAYKIWNEPWQVRWFGVGYVEEDGRQRIISPPNAPQATSSSAKSPFKSPKPLIQKSPSSDLTPPRPKNPNRAPMVLPTVPPGRQASSKPVGFSIPTSLVSTLTTRMPTASPATPQQAPSSLPSAQRKILAHPTASLDE